MKEDVRHEAGQEIIPHYTESTSPIVHPRDRPWLEPIENSKKTKGKAHDRKTKGEKKESNRYACDLVDDNLAWIALCPPFWEQENRENAKRCKESGPEIEGLGYETEHGQESDSNHSTGCTCERK